MPRMFGTDGVRGIANTELTGNLAYDLGRAGAQALTQGTHKPTVILGSDTRRSCDLLKCALMAGICSVGAHAGGPRGAAHARHRPADASDGRGRGRGHLRVPQPRQVQRHQVLQPRGL